MLRNSDLGVDITRHENEGFDEWLDRVGVHTLFAARDRQLRFEDQALAVVRIIRDLCLHGAPGDGLPPGV